MKLSSAHNVRYAITTLPSLWVKRPDVVIRDDGSGRWGTKWLRKLVLRAARNLGMLRHLVEEFKPEPIVTFTQFDVNQPVVEYIWKAVEMYMEMTNLRPEDLIAYMGNDCFRKGMLEMRNSPGASFEMVMEGGNRGRYQMWGVDCIVSPMIEGLVVVPKFRSI